MSMNTAAQKLTFEFRRVFDLGVVGIEKASTD
jgi:hypothetical protein